MKYLKVKPFKELQAAESGIESDIDKSETMETCLTGLKRHVSNDSCIEIYESDDNKKVKMDPDIYIQKEAAGNSEKKLSTVQILGHELRYKQHGANVLFSNNCVMLLLSSKMPLKQYQQLESVGDSPNLQRRKAFISWTDLKDLLRGGLLDLATTEALSSLDEETDKDTDSIIINEEKIKFKVKNGVVYLDVKGAFSALGRLEEVNTNNWARVDSVLSSSGFSLKAAFKKKADGRNRNYINLKAFCLLIEINKTRLRGERLTEIVENIKIQQERISREFQHTVDMILRMSCLIPPVDNCEDIIDLSSSEVDTEPEGNMKDSASSGIESEDFSPPSLQLPTPRKPLLTFPVYDSDEDTDVTEQPLIEDFVELLGVQIPIHVKDEKIYLEKAGLVKILGSSLGFLKSGIKCIENALVAEGVSLDEAFLYLSRQKLYLSLSAFQVLLSSQQMENLEDKTSLLGQLEKIRANFESEKNQLLILKSFESIKYKVVNGTIFIDSQKLLEMSGFSPNYFYHAPAKANLLLCKILSERGENTANCFLRSGKSKYAFITVSAATVLLRSDIGYLKDLSISTRLLQEIHQALDGQNIVRRSVEKQDCVTVLEDFPPIKYKLFDGQLFLHRKSSFECLQLEESVLSSKKGYQSFNNILKLTGVEVEHCYLASRHNKYCYISCLALLQLLQSQDPLIVCLANKDRFLSGLLNLLEQAVTTSSHLLQFSGKSLEIKSHSSGRVYLHKASVYDISGLGDKVCMIC